MPAHPAPTTSSLAHSPRLTPLWVVMLFTFVNSVGGGIVSTGYSFLADSAFQFSIVEKLGLGLLQGVVYIVGALAVGPALGRLLRTIPGVSTRSVLAGVMLALAGLCAIPWLSVRSLGLQSSAWSMWVLIGGYSVLTGVLWPIVESYMSGGRGSAELRRATGWFNVVWSSALVLSFFLMGPVKKDYSLELVLAVGLTHVLSIGLLLWCTPNPAAHAHADHAPLPAVYTQLLSVFRMQLVASYTVYSAITPILPTICALLVLPEKWQTPIVAVWLASRAGAFAVLQQWHGWHGRWATARWGIALLVVGFAGVVLAGPIAGIAGRGLGIASLVVGLALFGVAMGVVYTAAIYYAMAVGSAEVDAGGKHEALIGLGYGGGPVCGLLASGAVGVGLVPAKGFELLVLVLVSALALAICGLAIRLARRHAATASR